jgi:hypothetical protein
MCVRSTQLYSASVVPWRASRLAAVAVKGARSHDQRVLDCKRDHFRPAPGQIYRALRYLVKSFRPVYSSTDISGVRYYIRIINNPALNSQVASVVTIFYRLESD